MRDLRACRALPYLRTSVRDIKLVPCPVQQLSGLLGFPLPDMPCEHNVPVVVQVLMKDSDTRKFLFFIPRADKFDEQYTADIQANGSCAIGMQRSFCEPPYRKLLIRLVKAAGADGLRHVQNCYLWKT